MKRRHAYAFTIVEVTAAAAMLAIILGALVPTVLLVQTQRRERVLQCQALDAADNLLERVLALDWHDIQSPLPDGAIGADEVLDGLTGGTWRVDVAESPGSLPAKRVTVRVVYGTSGRTGTVRLAAWALDNAPLDDSE